MSVNRVLTNSIIYSGISVLQKAISFFLLPLYTAYLTAGDIGIIAVVTSIVNILSILFGLGLNSAANRFYYEFKEDQSTIRKLFGTIFSFVILNSLFLSALLIVGNKYILAPFSRGIPFYPFILLGVIITFLSTGYNMYQYILQSKQYGKQYGLNNIVFFIINVLSTIILLVVFKLKASSVLISLAITNCIFFIYTIWKFLPQINPGIDKRLLKLSLSYSFPLIPHSLASWFMIMVNTVLLNNIAGTVAAGIYSVGFQLGNIVNITTSAVNQAFVPWFFNNFREGNMQKITRFAEIMVALYAFLALGLSFFGKEILDIMIAKGEFDLSWSVVPSLSFAFVFSGIYYFASAPLFYNTKTIKFIPVITILSAIINVPLNLILIPRYNIQGAAVSSLLSLIVSAIMAQVLSMKYEPVKFNWTRMYFYVLICMALSIVSFLKINSLVLVLIKVIILSACTLFILLKYKSDIYSTLSVIWIKNGK